MIQSLEKKFVGVAVDFTFKLPGSGIFTQAFLRFNTKPTTAGSITITKKHPTDTDFDTVIETIDPTAATATTSVVYAPSVAIPLRVGETIQVQYANPNNRTIAITLAGLDSADF